MAKSHAPIGIERLHSLELCVHDAAPWLAYFVDGFGFQSVAASTPPDEERTGTRRRLVRAGDVRVVVQEAVHAGSFVKRYLLRHPEGLSGVNFQVADIERTESLLVERNANPTDAIRDDSAGDRRFRHVSIPTPLGDVEYCFIQCDGDTDLLPGLEVTAPYDATRNPAGIRGIDHLAANVRALMPLLAWYEHVLGFKRCWSVEFHTESLRAGVGGGLRSVAVVDPGSGLKLASNEPLRPRFHESQVQLCVEQNRGPGIQHVALAVADIAAAVDHCTARGVRFVQTPRPYYQALPARLAALGVAGLPLTAEEMQRRQLLIDGGKTGWLMQAFCIDQVQQLGRSDAGPLFIELARRHNWEGLGEGNFRALFESAITPQPATRESG